MDAHRRLRLRRDVLTELTPGELSSVAGATNDVCVTTLLSPRLVTAVVAALSQGTYCHACLSRATC